MTQAIRSAVIPSYILLCIGLGGSVQGVWGVAALQLVAIAIIGWSLLAKDRLSLSGPAKALFIIAGLTVLISLVQLIPLPPAMWSALPAREQIADGYRMLGQVQPNLPISLTPYDTAATVLTLLPPLAVLTGMLVAGAYRASWLALAILLGALAAVLLGTLQVGGSGPNDSPWYLYSITNYGFATGFFANSNHMATLLAISIPFLFAFIANLRQQAKNQKAGSAVFLVAIAGVLVLLVGIFLNGSLAVLLLGPAVVMTSATMLLPHGMKLRGPLTAVAMLAIAAVLLVYLTPLNNQFVASNATSFESRQAMWSTTIPAIKDNIVLGTGVGSFDQVYPTYEDAAAVTPTFVNHAHNDYLEIALETGIPGILLVGAFLLWWGRRSVPIWRAAARDRYALAGLIASGAILVHSLVDYPLRTAALSTIMAASLALMARPRPPVQQGNDLWPTTRHEKI
ncbi:O-antigen ligase family protein [Sphingomonas sp.]|uniref:O-antigen ligase family protein n=1 Tax=Sphingomonas sp. TaxID=28214 RepID=UPI00286AEC32|nr:O-antigen ligase family protein [Sphingomonas sp.]